jgi:methyl-accepting chemotaxis protein
MRWTVSRRITAGFATILGLEVMLALVAGVALLATSARYRAAIDEGRGVLVPALQAESQVADANLSFLRYLSSGDESFARELGTDLAESRNGVQRLRDTTPDAAARATWDRALTRLGRWEESVGRSLAAARAGRHDEAVRLWNDRALPDCRTLREAIDSAVAQAAVLADGERAAAGRDARRMEWLLLFATLVAVAVGVVSAVLLGRAVNRPLRETTGVLAATAAEILAATTQQASGAGETSAAIAQTAATVDEVAQTAEQAADRARMVADSAQRAAEIGRAGRQAVEESVAAMQGITEQVSSIADSILVLAEQAQAIGEIIATVNDLADQTNLLALNAAVEAARAGEHGRGFAVVAGEVRSLADQSKRATVQVRQILGEIQRATSAAVMTTERGSHQASAGMQQATAAGETIRALADAATEASQAAAQIVASAGQQAAGMSQIRQSMGSIHEATQQNVAATRQAEQAALDLNRLGKRLLDVVGRDGTHLVAAEA